MDDYDHLILDIEHGINAHWYDKKADDEYASYFNWFELDFIVSKYFEYHSGRFIYNDISSQQRLDNLFYNIYTKSIL